MIDDFDDVPESDPYCAHYVSIEDPTHDFKCAKCGHSCHDHPPSSICIGSAECDCRCFVNPPNCTDEVW